MANTTNFPNGFLAGITLRGLPILQTNPGNIYWVGNGPGFAGAAGAGPGGVYSTRMSGGSDNNAGTFQRPFATITQALQMCVHGAGDIILVKPGHVEFCTGADGIMAATYDPTGAIVTSTTGGTYNFRLNVNGVAIIGLGSGNFRPTIVWNTATGATIPVRSANMSIQNFRFIGSFAAVASAFTHISSSSATSTITAQATGTPCTYNAVGAVSTIWPGAALTGSTVLPGTYIVQQLTGTANGIGTYQIWPPQPAVTSFTAVTGPWDFNIESCDLIDAGTALNILALVTTTATANTSSGLRIANCNWYNNATSGACSLVKPGAAFDRLTMTDNFINSQAATTGALLIPMAALIFTNVNIGRNKASKPTTAATGSLVTGSGSTSSGMFYDNYSWTLATSTGLIITASTGIGAANNFGTITGSSTNPNAIINPTAA